VAYRKLAQWAFGRASSVCQVKLRMGAVASNGKHVPDKKTAANMIGTEENNLTSVSNSIRNLHFGRGPLPWQWVPCGLRWPGCLSVGSVQQPSGWCSHRKIGGGLPQATTGWGIGCRVRDLRGRAK
jgi:hypothetical protein